MKRTSNGNLSNMAEWSAIALNIENLKQRYTLPNPPVKIIEIPCKP
jgi:hypothetical protein